MVLQLLHFPELTSTNQKARTRMSKTTSVSYPQLIRRPVQECQNHAHMILAEIEWQKHMVVNVGIVRQPGHCKLALTSTVSPALLDAMTFSHG